MEREETYFFLSNILLSHGYQQLLLEKKEKVTISTIFHLFPIPSICISNENKQLKNKRDALTIIYVSIVEKKVTKLKPAPITL